MFGYPGQHLRADLFSLMKCKDIIRPARTGKNAMGSAVLSFDCPADAEQGSEDMPCSFLLTAIGSCRDREDFLKLRNFFLMLKPVRHDPQG